jgi:hypothetical protein
LGAGGRCLRFASHVELETTGQGKEGAVSSLVAKWTLTMIAVPVCRRVLKMTGGILDK